MTDAVPLAHDPASRLELTVIQPALPTSLPALRHAVGSWLAAAGWPAAELEDIELALNEAVANVIEHAYPDDDPGPVHLQAWIASAGSSPALWPALSRTSTPEPAAAHTSAGDAGDRAVTLVVSDRGRWTEERRTVASHGYRGRGLAVMTALMAQVHVQRDAAGTAVILVSRPSRPQPPA